MVAEAFLHHETRRIDEAGCFSLGGSRYEASAALANMEAEIAYDPMDEDEVYKISACIPRMINCVCEKALMYACQQQKRLVDEHMVRFVAT